MGTLATIALGLANSLIARAADVTLKERRPLILCVRETPFNRIHLRNMTLAAEAGATIFPCIPAFYTSPRRLHRHGAPIRLPRAGAHRPSPARRLRLEAGVKQGPREKGTRDQAAPPTKTCRWGPGWEQKARGQASSSRLAIHSVTGHESVLDTRPASP